MPAPSKETNAVAGFTDFMRWRLKPDAGADYQFENYDGFWMFTNLGVFWNSMDYLYRPELYAQPGDGGQRR